MGEDKVELKQVLQVCVVVEDIQRSMERYWEIFGIGPWQIYTFAPPDLTEPMIRGRSEPYTMKLAVAQVGSVQWELIEPLTGPSIYAEFLKEHGEGLHHVACAVEDFDQAVAGLEKRDMGVLMAGTWKGTTYAYMDTEKAIGAIVEIYKMPADFEMPAPEAEYPPAA
jgi:methylmalonyl-CoA/ethylmalonyl-CoA epimerase